jgi:hypothetical protein
MSDKPRHGYDQSASPGKWTLTTPPTGAAVRSSGQSASSRRPSEYTGVGTHVSTRR